MDDFFVEDLQRGAGEVSKGTDILGIFAPGRFFFFFARLEHHLPEGIAILRMGLFKAHILGHIFHHFVQSLVAEILCMIPVTCQTVAGLGDQQGFLHAEGRRQKIINLLLLFRG